MKRTQTKRKTLKHRKLAVLVLQCRPHKYEFSPYLDSFFVSVGFKRKKLPSGFRDDDVESRSFSVVAFLRSAFMPDDRRATLCFSVDKV